jgi:hypothetical protein
MVAPGQLLSHYAPRRPLFLLPQSIDSLSSLDWKAFLSRLKFQPKNIGLISISGCDEKKLVASLRREFRHERLCKNSQTTVGSDLEAARNLFAVLRGLDGESQDGIILAELPTEKSGLWLAIADRLQRASYREISLPSGGPR